MITELFNVNKFLDFVVVELFSKKTNKKYYAIALKIDNEYYVIKFLTETQKNAIIKL